MPTIRKPQQTPGPAVTEGERDYDFTLPAALYYDSVYFFVQAEAGERNGDIYATDRFTRASVLAAFAFLEATLNQAAVAHAEAHSSRLPQFELDVLEQKETVLEPSGQVLRKTRYYPFESRFLFIVQFLSGKEFDRGSSLWPRLKEARKIRDTWTHPKPPFDTWSLNLSDARNVVETIRDVLLDIDRLMGLERQPWLVSVEDAMAALSTRSDFSVRSTFLP